ncbi:MAG: OmpA family protein [Thiobacillaceae bacterium]
MNWVKTISILALSFLVSTALPAGALARGPGNGGFHGVGGFHGGGRYDRGGHFYGGLYFGAPLFWGPGYFYPYPYTYPYFYPPYDALAASPPAYSEKESEEAATAPQSGYWYYCANRRGYYPYVQECPGGWQVVAPQPPPPPVSESQAVPPAVAPKKLILEGVYFDNDSAHLSSESSAILDRAAATLQQWGGIKVEVAGYTDSVSTDNENIVLSKRRANVVRDYLISKGIDASRLTAVGYGKANPIADNNTPEGRFKNRRVELIPQ